MAIPVHLQAFKAAGIYRVVFDHSTMLNTDTNILRLVVGYSEKGPFNTPVYVKDIPTFKALFGDISKKLEKRGIFFHRMAMQMLQVTPILCLNLKKFDGETVSGATIASDFNPNFEPIETVSLNVEDIYDTTRFWELNSDKLNELRSASGTVLDQYINICATNVKSTSATYFIRKASGQKVAGYNITVNDWYSDHSDEMPEWLEPYKNNLMSDFFAEIYVFKGKFTAKQVLASDTLKNYFIVTDNLDENDEQILKLRPNVINAFGDSIDTLDALYNDETSNALGHYIGSLIPYFKNKQGSYASLDIAFNNDIDTHNLMMSFNVDLLEEAEAANIDLSGRMRIPTNEAIEQKKVPSKTLSIEKVFAGNATTTVLGNVGSPVVSDTINFHTNVYDPATEKAVIDFYESKTRIMGTLYVKKVDGQAIKLGQVGKDQEVYMVFENEQKAKNAAAKLGVKVKAYYTADDVADGHQVGDVKELDLTNGYGTYWVDGEPFVNSENPLEGPERIITAVSRLETADSDYTDLDENFKPTFMDVEVETTTKFNNKNLVGADAVYGSSVSFIDFCDDNWSYEEIELVEGIKQMALVSTEMYDNSLSAILQPGDCILAKDGAIDMDGDGLLNDNDNYFDTVYVQEMNTRYDENGKFMYHYVLVSGEPYLYSPADADVPNKYLVRIDAALNQEIGTMIPQYLEGYTYTHDRPVGTGMYAKVEWQNFILSALTDYKGLRTGLLNKAEIDYRYVVDTFESYPVSGLKNQFSYLCKEKQSAFCIANFPAVQSFVKCPYTSFTDANGVFNVEYVVKGYNKKKASAMKFSLPGEVDGASFIAFYTPLKFSDGYIDSIIPSAGLVSNLFIEKYMSRQPYYIVAGPNYGSITASGLVGPDYKYSSDELQIIEPFGVNCMVYRPAFGTFINANQTAKQTPVSALSKVNIRELVIYLQDEVEKVLQAYQWEFNNQVTRNAILDKANHICSVVKANGGIQSYLNVMDESNNTPEIIDNEMAILSTHIEPGFGCGKMVHELHLYRTGMLSSVIAEQ